ncbi:MAG: hypothetical protein EPN23_04155 [Verrucomicrobia bacterium]|nr:MAG: hypothetical protein EPN23_04155 [Verrucomicrobiota bacterium]
MRNMKYCVVVGLLGCWMTMPAAWAQRPYIGFAYPAGGQQGTTFHVKLGGQTLDGVDEVLISGAGVKARVVEYFRPLNPQEMQLLGEQLRELKHDDKQAPDMMAPLMNTMMMDSAAVTKSPTNSASTSTQKLIAKIEKRMAEYVQRPASAAIAAIAIVEVTIAPDAPPGERELRLATPRGISNPMVFHVGQLPEVSRKPMLTSQFQVLGKEELALRRRPTTEVEDHITVPCTVNGQVASGEINRYRFAAHQGQRLVISTQARQLIPYIADAVPGWFQPVLVLYDANRKELAYDDDFRFKPDPVIWYEIPKDGDYVFAIYDSIYRGREDFVYRITIGELPFVTSIFPLGGRTGVPASIKMKGWNLTGAELQPPPTNTSPGICCVTAHRGTFVSNRVPFMFDTLPECFDQETNDTPARAQKVKLPIIINGRIDRPDDRDVFQFEGKAGDHVVAEVYARRLDSPLDSVLKLTDATGKILALNDDCEDLGSGVNTHHADSYLTAKLPADGTYFIHLGDTDRKGGEEYAYRLRISAPRPDFILRAVPSSINIPSRSIITNENTKLIKTNAPSYTSHAIHVIRKDGFTGPIKLGLKNPPPGFSAQSITLTGTQAMTRLTIKCNLVATHDDFTLTIEGRALIDGKEVAHDAVPAEDRMQAFLWRHLVPAQEFKALVFDPATAPETKRYRKGKFAKP